MHRNAILLPLPSDKKPLRLAFLSIDLVVTIIFVVASMEKTTVIFPCHVKALVGAQETRKS